MLTHACAHGRVGGGIVAQSGGAVRPRGAGGQQSDALHGAAEAAALGHQHGPFYYFGSLPGVLVPWTLVFIPALVLAIRRFRQEPALSWLVGPFLLLTIASTKRSLYLAPLLPACAIMIAAWLNEPNKAKWERIILYSTWGLIVAGALAPLAGIFLGLPVAGIAASVLAIGALAMIEKDRDLVAHRSWPWP